MGSRSPPTQPLVGHYHGDIDMSAILRFRNNKCSGSDISLLAFILRVTVGRYRRYRP